MAQFHRIAADQAMSILAHNPHAQLLDVRAEADFARDHIEGATHFTQNQLPQFSKSRDKHTPILIYCYHGNASQVFAQFFCDFRFEDVYSIDGGYEHLCKLMPARADQPKQKT